MITGTVRSDVKAIREIILDSGQFDEAGLAYVEQSLQDYLDGESDGLWLSVDTGEPVGVACCAPEPVTQGTWDLLMLWIRRNSQYQGHGLALLSHLERALADASARLLIVATSGLAEFENARKFYRRAGFVQAARIKDFFAEGDDKLVYTKAIGRDQGSRDRAVIARSESGVPIFVRSRQPQEIAVLRPR